MDIILTLMMTLIMMNCKAKQNDNSKPKKDSKKNQESYN